MKNIPKYAFLIILISVLLPLFSSAQWLETTIPVGNGPRTLVYNSTNNKIYSANYYSDNVTVIDGAANSVVTSITVGDTPCALVYNPTNNKIYCANYYSDSVTVIDGETDSVIMTVGVGYSPCALAYNSTYNINRKGTHR